jgi:hypothetical protein
MQISVVVVFSISKIQGVQDRVVLFLGVLVNYEELQSTQ